MHEASLHDQNCFITLTYNNEFLPRDGSLDKSDYQKFMKRLRKRFPADRIRYFQCGEYGEDLKRPHYHACLFGMDFPDKIYYSMAGDSRLYISPLLTELWPFGFSTIGDVTFESAAYVARYVTKKVTGELAKEHYLQVDRSTGEIAVDDAGDFKVRVPEYVCMSRRPGLARGWFERFSGDVYPSDEVIARGFPSRPPRYYDKLFEAAHGESSMDKIKHRRIRKAKRFESEQTPERLAVREVCAERRAGLLRRGYEGGKGGNTK